MASTPLKRQFRVETIAAVLNLGESDRAGASGAARGSRAGWELPRARAGAAGGADRCWSVRASGWFVIASPSDGGAVAALQPRSG